MKNKTNLFSLITVCRRKDDVKLHEEDKIGTLLGDKNHSSNGSDCSHEDEECNPCVKKDKDKINQGMNAKHKN